MTDQFAACDWQLYPINRSILQKLLDITWSLGCDVVMKEVRLTNEGYFVFPLVFKFGSPSSLESIKTLSPLQDIANWRVVDKATFDLESTNFHDRHGTYDPKAGFVEWSHVFGKYNQTVKPD